MQSQSHSNRNDTQNPCWNTVSFISVPKITSWRKVNKSWINAVKQDNYVLFNPLNLKYYLNTGSIKNWDIFIFFIQVFEIWFMFYIYKHISICSLTQVLDNHMWLVFSLKTWRGSLKLGTTRLSDVFK